MKKDDLFLHGDLASVLVDVLLILAVLGMGYLVLQSVSQQSVSGGPK
jgi:hypothetical protein